MRTVRRRKFCQAVLFVSLLLLVPNSTARAHVLDLETLGGTAADGSISPMELTVRQLAEIKKTVALATLDPRSVRFGMIRASSLDGTRFQHVCGYVDGRDSSGNYIGYVPFFALLYDGTPTIDAVEIASPEVALQHFSGDGPFSSVEEFLKEDVRELEPDVFSAETISKACRQLKIPISPPTY